MAGIDRQAQTTMTAAGTKSSPLSFDKALREAMGSAKGVGSINLAKNNTPESFKQQVGLEYMAVGNSGFSTKAMSTGISLLGGDSPAETLNTIFDGLGDEKKFLNLNSEALPALKEVLVESGLSQENIDKFMAKISNEDMSLENIANNLNQLDLTSMEQEPSLTATVSSIPALSQLLNKLGVSAEAVSKVTSNMKPGSEVTAESLRQLIGPQADKLGAATLSESDVTSLTSMLESMGAGQQDLKKMSDVLNKNQGQMSLNDFLSFLETMEKAPAKPNSGQMTDLIKNILENVSREQNIAKTPVFNEILTKLQALGDKEIDDEFTKMSPALQALRGGISPQHQATAMSGQPGSHGNNREQRNNQEQRDQSQDIQTINLSSKGGESFMAAAAESTEALASYGGQESLARQISQKVAYNHRKGLHRLKMVLNPSNLGQIDIELKVKGGELTANIRAESQEAYDALSGDIDSLKQALSESGVSVNNLVVSIDDKASGQHTFSDLRSNNPSAALEINPATMSHQVNALRQGELDRVI